MYVCQCVSVTASCCYHCMHVAVEPLFVLFTLCQCHLVIFSSLSYYQQGVCVVFAIQGVLCVLEWCIHGLWGSVLLCSDRYMYILCKYVIISCFALVLVHLGAPKAPNGSAAVLHACMSSNACYSGLDWCLGVGIAFNTCTYVCQMIFCHNIPSHMCFSPGRCPLSVQKGCSWLAYVGGVLGLCSMVSPMCHGFKWPDLGPNNTYRCILGVSIITCAVGCRLGPTACPKRALGGVLQYQVCQALLGGWSRVCTPWNGFKWPDMHHTGRYKCHTHGCSLTWVAGWRLGPSRSPNRAQVCVACRVCMYGFVAWFHPCAMSLSGRNLVQTTHIGIYQVFLGSHV